VVKAVLLVKKNVIPAVLNLPFTFVVATFTDPVPGPVTDYAASIDWGDGTAPTPGMIRANGSGFDVIGTHTYFAETNFLIDLTNTDQVDQTSEVAESAAVVLTGPEASLLKAADFDQCRPNDPHLAAHTNDVRADLNQDHPAVNCEVTLFVGEYRHEP